MTGLLITRMDAAEAETDATQHRDGGVTVTRTDAMVAPPGVESGRWKAGWRNGDNNGLDTSNFNAASKLSH